LSRPTRSISCLGQSEHAKTERRLPHPPTSSHVHLDKSQPHQLRPSTQRAKSANMQPTFRRMAGHNHGSTLFARKRCIRGAIANDENSDPRGSRHYQMGQYVRLWELMIWPFYSRKHKHKARNSHSEDGVADWGAGVNGYNAVLMGA
jgi:hypothetical protein